MAICKSNVLKLSKMLDAKDMRNILSMADNQEKLESHWINQLKKEFKEIEQRVVESLIETGKVPKNISFEYFFLEHYISVSQKALRDTHKFKPDEIHLAKSPTSFLDVFKIWKRWREKGQLPAVVKKNAEEIKQKYLEKVNSFWHKYSEEFREGKVYNQNKVLDALRKETKMPIAQAKTIVNTETTRYYNKVRRDVYDQSPDVTHYLFVAIRDMATTKWCSTRTGLVYEKNDPLLDIENPPIHWNCRSEMIPLTPINPRHAKIISDKSKQRRNHNPEPLPRGWNSGSRAREVSKRK